MSYPRLERRLADVRERIAEACARSGRSIDEVTLVAVTKGHPVDAVRAILELGVRDIGENRVQEMDTKASEGGVTDGRWHLIGHLQRNKAKRAIELAQLIHSVDSIRLAEKISQESAALGRVTDVLVQVNVSGEETKGGLEGTELIADLARICALPGIRVLGLMTMAPFTDDVSVQREVFSATRAMAERAKETVEGFEGLHLSMGMSGDFEVAVEEGSTLVRLGTVLFGER